MRKALAYLIHNSDSRYDVEEALRLLQEETAEVYAQVINSTAAEYHKLEGSVAEITKERDFYKSQFEQATGLNKVG